MGGDRVSCSFPSMRTMILNNLAVKAEAKVLAVIVVVATVAGEVGVSRNRQYRQ